ncbi:hypothetical protein CLU79DRAFT_733125 [Phycomyces nitens]|nr:hypothetical protein CLU79DRAFT_733125 [Phycomyces nitens]
MCCRWVVEKHNNNNIYCCLGMFAARITSRIVLANATRQTLSGVAKRHLRVGSPLIAPIRPTQLFTPVQRYSTQYHIADLTPEDYHKVADKTFDSMVERLETIGDEIDMDEYDIEYSQGVMTLKLGEHGTYVLNKQPPNRQIWFSSPKSGPKRFDYDLKSGKWFYPRDNHTLNELFNEELSEILKQDIDLFEAEE